MEGCGSYLLAGLSAHWVIDLILWAVFGFFGFKIGHKHGHKCERGELENVSVKES